MVSVQGGRLMSRFIRTAIVAIFFLALLTLATTLRAQQASIVGGLVEGVTGGLSNTLVGNALTSIGLNSQSSFQTDVVSQLEEINTELQTISAQLTDIQNAIQTQTCVDELSSSSVTNALTSIATVSNTYTNLLEAGESTTGSVSQADINNFLDQVANGPGGGLPSISAALVALNIALQSTGNDGIIGTCEKAVTTVPSTGSFAADLTFYSDPINLLQYFADYETVGTLLLVEYYNYQAFLSSTYYSASTVSNGLPANEAPLVCAGPTGQTATECGFARNALEQLYVYLQNQYSANGVPYSTDDSSGNLQTGLYIGTSGTNYLFATSLEEYTTAEDAAGKCSSPLTSASPCGLAFGFIPTDTPWSSSLPAYQYETGWVPATAPMWRSLLSAWVDGSSSNTLADGLTSLGFQNASDKIILTPTEYTATPSLEATFGTHPVFGDGLLADCFLDTNQKRSIGIQPWCYNGSTTNGLTYGPSTDLISLTSQQYVTVNDSNCDAVITNSDLSATNDPCFYDFSTCSQSALYVSNQNWNNNTGSLNKCPNPGEWENGITPSWLVGSDGTVSTGGYFWPALDVSSPTCGTNLSYGLLQPALTRSSTNFLGVPTMCGEDFDLYFATVAPRNPYQQVAFTTSAVSGASSSAASLGPITIQMQDTSTGTTEALTSTSATTVALTSTSSTGVFSLTQGGSAITSVTIAAGSSSATFYYGDSTAGAPQITADPGTMVPGVQEETITSSVDATELTVGTAENVGSSKNNGQIILRGRFTIPNGIQLQRANLTFNKILSEDSGSGELVRDANGSGARLPVVLATLSGSKPSNGLYATQGTKSPRVRVEVKAIKGLASEAKFLVVVDDAEINTPSACTGNKSVATLHTRMTANDGVHPVAAFDANLDWKCRRNGTRLTTVPSRK